MPILISFGFLLIVPDYGISKNLNKNLFSSFKLFFINSQANRKTVSTFHSISYMYVCPRVIKRLWMYMILCRSAPHWCFVIKNFLSMGKRYQVWLIAKSQSVHFLVRRGEWLDAVLLQMANDVCIHSSGDSPAVLPY